MDTLKYTALTLLIPLGWLMQGAAAYPGNSTSPEAHCPAITDGAEIPVAPEQRPAPCRLAIAPST